jgi:hypothetical protein
MINVKIEILKINLIFGRFGFIYIYMSNSILSLKNKSIKVIKYTKIRL